MQLYAAAECRIGNPFAQLSARRDFSRDSSRASAVPVHPALDSSAHPKRDLLDRPLFACELREQQVHLIISFCNVRCPGVHCLAVLDTTSTELSVLDLPSHTCRNLGVTGLASSEKYFYAISQGVVDKQQQRHLGQATLLTFTRDTFIFLREYPFKYAADVHSILARDNLIYALSTGTDELVCLETLNEDVVSERVVWSPPGGSLRKDTNHLNSLCWHDGSLLVSGFGKRRNDGGWESADSGLIFRLANNDIVAHGIRHPHSLTSLGSSVAYCESQYQRVVLLGGRCSEGLPGYSRGMCSVGDNLFVGTSKTRVVSRSEPGRPALAGRGTMTGECAIAQLCASNLTVEKTWELGLFAREIYDILPLDEAGHWPTVSRGSWATVTIGELVAIIDALPPSVSCVFSDNHPVGPRSVGVHEVAAAWGTVGWAWDPDQPDSPVRVDIYVDDTLIASVRASKQRPDLALHGIGGGNHGFEYYFPAHIRDGAAHVIRTRLAGTELDLIDSPRTTTLSPHVQ
jgi:Domain of unknown function (DUF4915)